MRRWSIPIVAALLFVPSALGADIAALHLTSATDDPVGQGVTINAATPQDPVGLSFFGVGQEGMLLGQGVQLNMSLPEGYTAVGIGVPTGQHLQVGVYSDAIGPSFPLDPSRPTIGVIVQGRACETTRGNFTVTRADYTPRGNLYALDATFAVTECNGTSSSITGSIGMTHDTIETTIDPSVRIRGGQVTVSGNVFCSLPHAVDTSVDVTQPVDVLASHAQKYTGPLQCVPGGVVPWTVTMSSQEGKALKPGQARVSTFSSAADTFLIDIQELIVRMTGR